MKNLSSLVIACLFTLASSAQFANFHDFSAETINHDTLSMSHYYGQKVMVVNTASFCAYTYQYGTLQALDSAYKQYGFHVIGFPCNDFAGQDPHDDSTIEQFCTGTYNVQFQMMSKVKTISSPIDPIYQWLENASQNGVSNANVTWNFNKFLIDEAGHWVKHYTNATEPNDPAIIAWIVDTPSVVQTTGIIEKSNDNFIEMKSTNPGSSLEFVVKNSSPKEININLYNTEGQLLKSVFSGMADNNQSISTDVSTLAAGIYLVRVTGKGIEQTLKFVK